MKYKKILFRSLRPSTSKLSSSLPQPTQNNIPNWYRDADRFAKNQKTNEYIKANKQICPFPKEGTEDDYGLMPTWKACPAILDGFLTGYVLKTPCDIKFFKKGHSIEVDVKDKNYKDFCTKRYPMPQFEQPKGYYREHFAWYPDWGISLPDGYSCLYLNPINRFDLPFWNTTGIVDNDKINISGTFPFFLLKDWEGILPAGTPYMQIIPFKRENWEHNIEILDKKSMYKEIYDNMLFYRQPDGGVYKSKIWSKREYK